MELERCATMSAGNRVHLRAPGWLRAICGQPNVLLIAKFYEPSYFDDMPLCQRCERRLEAASATAEEGR